MDESTALNMELSRNIMGALMDDNVNVDEVIKQQKMLLFLKDLIVMKLINM